MKVTNLPMKASEIRAEIRDAERRGQYMYFSTPNFTYSIRIIDAKQSKGRTFVRAINGEWQATTANFVIYTQ